MGITGFFKSFIEGGKVDIGKRYEILREAISGTMSNFYMARDKQSDQIVGLKILDKEKNDALEMRFKGLNKPSEGEIAASFRHARIVNTLGHGLTTKGEQFVVMEFLDGPGLNSLIVGKSPLLDGNRLTLMRHAAEALGAVHDVGYIHRDICPRNFVCTKDAKSLKLIDFGLSVPNRREFQQPGIRTGTPSYMAPEVVRRRPTDQRLDIFSYGVSMYEMFAFELPWGRGTGDGMSAMGHGQSSPTPIEKYYPTINPVLRGLIHKCIEPEPQQRLQTMKIVIESLKTIKHEDAK